MARTYLFTSESVSDGHPDKVADQISDAILDWALERDPRARVACETFVGPRRILVGGEVSSSEFTEAEVNEAAPATVEEVVRGIGYGDPGSGLDLARTDIVSDIAGQSADIAHGVDRDDRATGAGDQGMMFGYACDETPERMPLAIQLAHALVRRHAEVRNDGTLPWLGPDAKSQVTVRYGDDESISVHTVVVSTQHAEQISVEQVRAAVEEHVIDPVVAPQLRLPEFRLLINPAGRFVRGGPDADTGLTGRKIIVDTYGGSCPHGGGAFSGKDATKVDRSAAYAARHVARNVVAAGLGRRCTLQLAYAIGEPAPVSLHVDLHGTGVVDEVVLEDAVRQVFDLTPDGIIEALELRAPRFRATAAYGHFGRPEFPWEREDHVDALLSAISEPAPATPRQLDQP
jgi:S-adenosylmethionine synthetase